MKNYHLYAFTQNDCQPCTRLRTYVSTLPKDAQLEVDFVPLKTANGSFTQLATELGVELTPTLVVVHEDLECELDQDGDEDCTNSESPVETIIGAKAIIDHLSATLNAYTYATV